jgi:NADPH:quinone reductase-like Zn-dependent oxidoreductase
MILKIFLAKNSAKKMAFFSQNKAKLCKLLIATLVFDKNANFFAEKLSKIAENCDHYFDPRLRTNAILFLRQIQWPSVLILSWP